MPSSVVLTAVSSWLVANHFAIALQSASLQLLRMLNVEEVPESFEQGAAKSKAGPGMLIDPGVVHRYVWYVGADTGPAMRADEVPEALREVAVKVKTCVSLTLASHQ